MEPSAEELLKRIQELEVCHAHIKQQISSKLISNSPKQLITPETTDDHHFYLNVFQSMGQAVHVFDRKYRIHFWNPLAEVIYGLSTAEVFGKTPTDILVDPKDAMLADYLLERTVNGESWSGEFPVRNQKGEIFVILCTNTPFRDENGRLTGGICVFTETRHYHCPLITSKVLTNLTEEDDDCEGEAISPRGPFGDALFSDQEAEIHLCRPKKAVVADEWMGPDNKQQTASVAAWHWPWKWKQKQKRKWMGNNNIDSSVVAKLFHFGWQRLQVNQEHQQQQKSSWEKQEPAAGLWLSRRYLRGDMVVKPKTNKALTGDIHSLQDYEITWDHLITKRLIGQGSCGTVYHGSWHGSDVAIKLFTYQEFSDDTMLLFKQEVSLMKRLRHPNILLFMGAVTCSAERPCIVTEFLPRGSLFQILQQKSTRLDCKRRLQMAIDIARGMNYLHRYNPPIVHRDLKSSNLLVDKNWIVKVGDFGLSRIKHQTYLNTKSGKGTPQWMAPEIIRSEQADEKSDVYSYGVVLWEIITEKIPWDDLNPMQVVAAVGFMDRRLEIPKDVDPMWTSLIQSCWCSDPQSRPTFQEILYTLKDLQKKYAVERRK